MKSYILPLLSRSDKDLLRKYGIRFHDWVDGILLDTTQLEVALQVLNLTIIKEDATGYEGIVQLSVRKLTGDTRAADPLQTARNSYIQMCSIREARARSAALAELAVLKHQLTAAQDEFAHRSRHAFVSALKGDDDRQSKFSEQFESLLAVNKVESVRVCRGSIFAYTSSLCAVCPETGASHQLGRFLIEINTSGTAGGVRWYNLTGTVSVSSDLESLHAPRVNPDGSAFANETSETLLELIAMFEFATALELAIQFVETACPDERRAFVKQWPEI